MFYYRCQCVKSFLTNIALHWWVGGPEMFIDLPLTAKVLMTFFAWELSFGVDIFPFQFIFYRDECFLFLFSRLIIIWLNCFLLHLNRCTNYFGFCLSYISWLWWRSWVRYLRCQWNSCCILINFCVCCWHVCAQCKKCFYGCLHFFFSGSHGNNARSTQMCGISHRSQVHYRYRC